MATIDRQARLKIKDLLERVAELERLVDILLDEMNL
jgi:hypothetical protein